MSVYNTILIVFYYIKYGIYSSHRHTDGGRQRRRDVKNVKINDSRKPTGQKNRRQVFWREFVMFNESCQHGIGGISIQKAHCQIRTAGSGQSDKAGHAVQHGFCIAPNSRPLQDIAAKTADEHGRQNHPPKGEGLTKPVDQLGLWNHDGNLSDLGLLIKGLTKSLRIPQVWEIGQNRKHYELIFDLPWNPFISRQKSRVAPRIARGMNSKLTTGMTSGNPKPKRWNSTSCCRIRTNTDRTHS